METYQQLPLLGPLTGGGTATSPAVAELVAAAPLPLVFGNMTLMPWAGHRSGSRHCCCGQPPRDGDQRGVQRNPKEMEAKKCPKSKGQMLGGGFRHYYIQIQVYVCMYVYIYMCVCVYIYTVYIPYVLLTADGRFEKHFELTCP